MKSDAAEREGVIASRCALRAERGRPSQPEAALRRKLCRWEGARYRPPSPSNPFRRAAIAAARPAGPPPMTKTSVFSELAKLPPQQNQFGRKSRPHRSQQSVGSRGRPPLQHHFFEHHQDGCGRKIAVPAQAIPGRRAHPLQKGRAPRRWLPARAARRYADPAIRDRRA